MRQEMDITMLKQNAQWIKPAHELGESAPLFRRQFSVTKEISKATLLITAMGVYEATLNEKRVGDFILAPGWTSYHKRLQVQEYDITSSLKEENELTVLVGKGWYRSPMGWPDEEQQAALGQIPAGLIAHIHLLYTDGSESNIYSDTSWCVSESAVRFSEIYDGEIYDASFCCSHAGAVQAFAGPTDTLIPQQGEKIIEQERLAPASIFTTPKGERVIDFGQNLTGYIEIALRAEAGQKVSLSFAEVLDKNGNFYTENYRAAKSQYLYTCKTGFQTYKPKCTFYGFRYIRIDDFPDGIENAAMQHFTAVTVHSELTRTGFISSSNPLLNQLFHNIIWGQKCNYLDVPTDCPQRNERLGWTGDAQAFVRTAALNFDVEPFFNKWLSDLKADQNENGCVGHYIPELNKESSPSAAWSDAACICPWEIYLAYGNKQILENQFSSMCKWVDFIGCTTQAPFLWTGCSHYGDWLGLDAPVGSCKGSSRQDFIASAFYAYSASLVIKAGKALGKDVKAYEQLYHNILQTFRRTFTEYTTQTECVLAAYFGLAEDPQKAVVQLVSLIEQAGGKLQTGFVGTPYLLHVLSDYGNTDLAYDLLLKTDYPSWLYPVTKGATTVWEHWDGIMENGDFWSPDMNSFNHYAYGAVADWIYTKAAGIQTIEEAPGYARVKIAPIPNKRLDWLDVRLVTRQGEIISCWKKQEHYWRFDITTPTDAIIVIGEEQMHVKKGSYCFFRPF